ncbi:MAG: hypothetical protein SF053_21890 [Bacteroidia bacterium]|nr:hypothetical protein [Bacteroidia bacterium]
MEYRFDILFRLQLVHPGLRRLRDGFGLLPTSDCVAQLRRHGLLFKAVEDGAWIAVEKQGGIPVRPIQEVVSFRFWLLLQDASLLEKTEDFDADPADPFPAFIGRSRLAYFTNLDNTLTLDGRIQLAQTAPAVSKDDLGSLAPQVHRFIPHPSASQVTAAPVVPGGGAVQSFTIPADRQVQLDLTAGAWRIAQPGSPAPTEVLLADDRLVGSRTFGLIEIFKAPSVDYNTPVTYTLTFNSIP